MSDPVEDVVEETTEDIEADTAALFEEFSNGDADETANDDVGEEDTSDDPQGESLVADEEAPEGEETSEVPAGDEADTDPFAEASDEVKAAYEASQLEISKLTHKLKSDDGRVSALHRKINALETAAKVPAVSPKDFASAFKDKDSWKEFAEDNPEMAKPIEEFMQGLAAATAENLEKTDQKVAKLDEAAVADSDTQAQDDLTAEYPDWLEWIASADYIQWIAKQPPTLQAIVEDGSVEDSLALLGLYKTHLKASGKLDTAPPDPKVAELKKKRSRQLQDGTQTPSKGGSAKPISENDTPSLFDFFAKKRAS